MPLKTKLYILFVKFIFITNIAFCQKDFSNRSISSDSTYGYNEYNPIKLKDGNQQKSIANSIIFLKGLKTLDDQNLNFLSRSSVSDPNYKERSIRLTNRFTGMPLSGKLGLLDRYVFVTSRTKDTIVLYLDIYNKGDIKLPINLKWRE